MMYNVFAGSASFLSALDGLYFNMEFVDTKALSQRYIILSHLAGLVVTVLHLFNVQCLNATGPEA